jgi:ribosome-associated toxin RatA of RatAB toxin-antitoxin module
MREVKRSALIKMPPNRLFALINDIDSYPQFLPWCTHSRVLSRSDSEIVASIGVRRGPFTGDFTTRNALEPYRRIHMRLVDGPFSALEGQWRLTPAGEGTQVELMLRFQFKNTLSAVLFERIFAETVGSLVDAFVARSRDLQLTEGLAAP